MKRAKSAIIYGESGTFKTTSVGQMAKYIYEKTGKTTRLVSGDGGGWDAIQPLIDLKIIEAYNVVAVERPLGVLWNIAKGFWPTISKGKLELTAPTPETWQKVGAYACEGLTSFGDVIMSDMLRRDDIRLPEQPKDSQVTDGVETWRFSGRSHYGFIQDRLYDFVRQFGMLPVEMVLWTALEGKTQEENTTNSIYGPAIKGKASIAKSPAWFGDCIHHESIMRDEINEATKARVVTTKVRAYFQRHPDPDTGIHYPAKARVPPSQVGKLLEKFPGGFYTLSLEAGFDLLLKAEDELLAAGTEGLSIWKDELDKARQVTVKG